MWVPRIESGGGPLYLAIADAVAEAVAGGALAPGARLPTHRALAEALGVDLTTVTRAYAEARRRGLVDATVGRGTFVRAPEPRAASPRRAPVDLGMNLPPPVATPAVADLMRTGLAALLAGPDAAALLTYRPGAGTEDERRAGARWLAPTLGDVAPERVLVSAGAQPALLAALGTLCAPGDVVLAGRHTYPGLRTAAASAGLRLVAVDADADGLLPETVAEACAAHRPKALYCIPTIDNPTAATMPLARREAIVAVARRHGLMIVEDDAYGRLPSEPIPALAALAPDLVVHVATVSKVLSPALRIAFVVAPEGRTAARLAAALRANVLMPSPLLAGLVAAWVEDGTAETVVAAIRRESALRQRIARETLPPDAFAAHPEGLHVWLRLPPHWDRLAFTAHLQRQDGLAAVPSDAFAVGAAADAVRISLGAAADRDALRGALRAVARAARDDVPPAFAEVV